MGQFHPPAVAGFELEREREYHSPRSKGCSKTLATMPAICDLSFCATAVRSRAGKRLRSQRSYRPVQCRLPSCSSSSAEVASDLQYSIADSLMKEMGRIENQLVRIFVTSSGTLTRAQVTVL